jgi:hypothetical protein
MNATDLHDQLQVALAESWDRDDRDYRRAAAMRATRLAHQLYKLANQDAATSQLA